jgi:sulfofructose kinase
MPLPTLLPRTVDRPFDVVGLGESSLDFVAVVSGPVAPDSKLPLDRFEAMPGGQTATALVACARLGHRTRYIGALGKDDAGAAIQRALERESVDVAAVWHIGVPSRVAVVLVDPESGRRTILERRDARLTVDPASVAAHVLCGRVLLIDGVDVTASLAAAQCARAAGIPSVVDVDKDDDATGELLRHVDIVVVPQSLLASLAGDIPTGEAVRRIDQDLRPAMTVATLGAEGSLARFEGREIRTPAIRVTPLDTTGAGDAFRGGLVSAWLRAGNSARVEDLLKYANAVAGLNCRALGAQTALPTPTEVDGFL